MNRAESAKRVVTAKRIIEALSWNYAKGVRTSYQVDSFGKMCVVPGGDHSFYLNAYYAIKTKWPNLTLSQVGDKTTNFFRNSHDIRRVQSIPAALGINTSSEKLRTFMLKHRLFAAFETTGELVVRKEGGMTLTKAQRDALERYCIEHEKTLIMGDASGRPQEVLYSPPSSDQKWSDWM